MAAHSSLTGSNLHEPKGVASASANTVYTSDGAGSGVWQKITASQINTASIFNTNEAYLTVFLPDVSTADTVFAVVPFTGTLTKVWTILDDVISGADATVTVRDHLNNSAGTITIANAGSAAGDIDSLTPGSNNTFTEGERVRIQTDGASSTAAALVVTLVFTITG